MAGLEAGALQLPLRHLSVRVPWNDTDWTGRVCRRPADNNACLILRRVRDARNDAQEMALAGLSWQDLPQNEFPPCVSEHGHFMAPYELTRIAEHPYVRSSPAHKHLAPTPFRYPPYSSAALPFSWMLRDEALTKARDLELGFEEELEDAASNGTIVKIEKEADHDDDRYDEQNDDQNDDDHHDDDRNDGDQGDDDQDDDND